MALPASSHPSAEQSTAEGSVIEDAPGPTRATTPAEQVEQRLQVTSPRMWLALAGFVVLIVVGLVWGILGRAADQVTGIGVMLPSAGLYDLSSPTPGIVQGIKARNGDELTAGETVLYLALADGSPFREALRQSFRESFRQCFRQHQRLSHQLVAHRAAKGKPVEGEAGG